MATATPPVAASTKAPLGLLAGGGRFPVVVAEKARRLGIPVCCVGIRPEATAELVPLVDEFHWVRLGGLGSMIRHFKRAGCERVVMAGKITKSVIHAPWRWIQLWPDLRTLRFWFRLWQTDNRDDSILLGVVREFARDGLTCESALDICPELLVAEGLLSSRPPTERETADIDYGWRLAKRMGGLDIGQSVVVQDAAAIAVEAIEGTDQAIRRSGKLCPEGGQSLVKVAKPQQDMRFDVPTVGCSTVENLHRAGGRVLAIEAGKTIVIDQPEVSTLADRYGITVVAWRRPCEPDAERTPPDFTIVENIGRRPLTEFESRDIAFAWEMARQMDDFAVGGSIAVREKAVVAVEAAETPADMILRTGRVCRGGGFVVLCVRKPNRDYPTVDEATLRALKQTRSHVLAIELADGARLPETLHPLADRYGLRIVGLRLAKD